MTFRVRDRRSRSTAIVIMTLVRSRKTERHKTGSFVKLRDVKIKFVALTSFQLFKVLIKDGVRHCGKPVGYVVLTLAG
jgi:hypothetical protein